MEEEVKTLCDKGARICSKESLITVLRHPIYPLDTVKDFHCASQRLGCYLKSELH